MAANVFGNPVTNDTVRQVYPNLTDDEITANLRAEVALLYMNSENVVMNVNTFVDNLKKDYGDSTSTLGMIYNATGGNLSFVLNHTWEGHVWRFHYPHLLQNGQWAGFLHVHGRMIPGLSKEAIVYRGTDNAESACDWMLAWETPHGNVQNRVYTEIRKAGGFDHANWNVIDRRLQEQTNHYSTTQLGCLSMMTIGNGNSPVLVGIIGLRGLAAPEVATEATTPAAEK